MSSDFEVRCWQISCTVKGYASEFIENCETLDKDSKEKLKEELWNYPTNDAIVSEVHRVVDYWSRENFKLVELWKDIAVNNAKVSSEPHKTANTAVAEFKKSFPLGEEGFWH
jgi:hypothetical protein